MSVDAKNVRQRLLFGLLMLLGMTALLAADLWLERGRYFGLLPEASRGLLFALFVALLAPVAAIELFWMARAKALNPLVAPGALVVAALAVSPFVATIHPSLAGLPAWVLGFGVMFLFFMQAAQHRVDHAIPNLAATLLGVGYLGVLAMFVVWIRTEPMGTQKLLLYLAAVKFTDMGAYAAGMTLGKHKMIPWLSPGKSWEGLAGGAIAAVAVSIAVALSTGVMGVWQAAVFGAVLAPVGQLGDLAESLLKRDSGLKDSGTAVPAFGGLLDILDSPLGAAPAGLLLIKLLATGS